MPEITPKEREEPMSEKTKEILLKRKRAITDKNQEDYDKLTKEIKKSKNTQ